MAHIMSRGANRVEASCCGALAKLRRKAALSNDSPFAYADSRLKTDLQRIDGFISIERFQSLVTPDKYVSISFWRDEKAIAAWRSLEAHRAAQNKGRAGVFADYRLRVASVVRDYGMNQRSEAPADSRAAHG